MRPSERRIQKAPKAFSLLTTMVIAATLTAGFASAAPHPQRVRQQTFVKKTPEKPSAQQQQQANQQKTTPPLQQPAQQGVGGRKVGDPTVPSRSSFVENHQPLVDEHIAFDTSIRNHLSFISPDSLSEFVVDDIAAEVQFLKKTLPTFEKTCLEVEGPDVDSEDGLLRCLKRLYFPSHPLFTGRSAAAQNAGMVSDALQLEAPADLSAAAKEGGDQPSAAPNAEREDDAAVFADGIRRDTIKPASAASVLDPLDEGMLFDAEGWMPMQIVNGSVYLCRMPREGDGELAENEEGDIVPKATLAKKKSDRDGVDDADGKKAKKKKNKANKKKTTKKPLTAAEKKARLEQALRDADFPDDKEESSSLGTDDGAEAEDEVPERDDAAADDDDATFSQLKPGQKLPRSLRIEMSNRMRGQCATKSAGWWMYEVCWEEHVRQYHTEGGQVTTSHFLGQGPRKKIRDGTALEDVYYNVHSVRGPYLSATFKNGSLCDVTGEPRIAEIRLFCEEEGNMANGGNRGAKQVIELSSGVAINLKEPNVEISEPETCTYLVWMGSPKACLKEISKPKGPILGIRCRNVDDL